ncbi:hypothetical protein HYY69_02060 [Candidatus Woesearchaeota archaeon]|nr:hypothetical protein [Candidatus Woesearchaeota archaeon]
MSDDSHIELGDLIGLLMRARNSSDIREKIAFYADFASKYDPEHHTVNEEGLATASKDITDSIATAYINDIRGKHNAEFRTRIINRTDDLDITAHLRSFLVDIRRSDPTYLHLAHQFNTATRAANTEANKDEQKLQLVSFDNIKEACAEATRQYLLNVVTEDMSLQQIRTGLITASLLLGGELVFEFHNAHDPVIERSLEKVLGFVQAQEYSGNCIQRDETGATIDYNATKRVTDVSIAARVTDVSIAADRLRAMKNVLVERGYSVNNNLQQRIDAIQERLDVKYKKEKAAVKTQLDALVSNMILAGFDSYREEQKRYGSTLINHLNNLKRKDGNDCQMFSDKELDFIYGSGQLTAGICDNTEKKKTVTIRYGPQNYRIEVLGDVTDTPEILDEICREASTAAKESELEIHGRMPFVNPVLGIVGQVSREQDTKEHSTVAKKPKKETRIALYLGAGAVAALIAGIIAHNHYAGQRLADAEDELCYSNTRLYLVEKGQRDEPDSYEFNFNGKFSRVKFTKASETERVKGEDGKYRRVITGHKYTSGKMQVPKASWQFYFDRVDLGSALSEETCRANVNNKINDAQREYETRGQVK